MIESTSESEQPQQLFLNLKQNPQPTKVQSFCMVCHQNGQTILLLTKIPFFKEMLIASFSCENCGHRNNQIQFVGQLPPKGVSIRFKVTEPSDLNRQIVKSEFASITFEELALQIPQSKRAQISTVQGILLHVENNLSAGQQQRKLVDHESYEKIQQFIHRIQRFRSGKVLPFHITLNDPSGNSNIKNPFAPKLDERLFFSYYTRTKQQIELMGYNQQNASQQLKKCDQNHSHQQCHKNQIKQQQLEDNSIKKVDFTKSVQDKDFMHSQPSVFQILCHACDMPGLMKLCQTNIPHFTDLIIMSFTCDFCGAHQTDTKTSGAVSDKSITITLNVQSVTDLKRDLFKSQSCCVKIPEIQLQLDYGTLGGAYTTVEGLLQKITGHMQDLNSFTDSDDDFAIKMKRLIKNLEDMMSGEKKFTLILQDPLSNSFLQNPYHPQDDKNSVRITRERTEQQKDFLGINQMQV